MLDPRLLRQEPDRIRRALEARGLSFDLDAVLAKEQERREIIVRVEGLKAERNQASTAIAAAKKAGQDASEAIAEMRRVGEEISRLDAGLADVEAELRMSAAEIPNVPHESVPVGKSEADNQVVRTWGEPPEFPFESKAHWEVGDGLGILDFERASKIAGARFALMVGAGARLERALINFMLDLHTGEHGYTEIFPPILVNEDSAFNTGQLPKMREDMFACTDDYFLIPTAEVPVTNIHKGEILEDKELPKRYAAYTPCFRREAGAHGKETRGLIRQHQFNKVELVKFSRPEDSYDELESLTNNAETVLQRLGLAYRVVALCTADLGFASAKTYDLEVWMPSYSGYKEISSCSNFEDFQARRAQIRFRDENKAVRLLHTLNGSGLAIGRTVAAILENYQREDGTVSIPSALISYMGGANRILAEGRD